MSKFLTPPVWYDKTGNKIDILNNETYAATGPDNTAIGTSAIAGRPSSEGVSFGAVAVGSQAQAKAPLSIAVGSYNDDNFQTVQALAIGSIAIGAGAKANTDSTDGIAIGSVATSSQGGIAIGAGASATANQIQLGNNNTAYTLNIGNGRMSLNIGSTAQDNWISATRNDISISQGLYLVRYGGGSYIDLVYLMAPIAITDMSGGEAYTNDWYFPFYTNPYRLTITNSSNNPSHPIVNSCYYLKVDKTSSASNLKITPGYYTNDGDNLTPVFKRMSDGSSVFLFKIL